MQNVMKLYGTTTSAGVIDGIASTEVTKTAFISAMMLEIAASGMVSGAYGQMEISLGSKSSFGASDTRQALGGIETDCDLGTSGGSNNARQVALSGLKIPILPGEKLYLHVSNGSF